MPITPPELLNHAFLEGMYQDKSFPDLPVDKCAQIFVRLGEAIAAQKPADNAGLLRLTHAATEEFSALAEEFDENGSELETVARETIAADFGVIAEAYGFDIDTEELISPRDW